MGFAASVKRWLLGSAAPAAVAVQEAPRTKSGQLYSVAAAAELAAMHAAKMSAPETWSAPTRPPWLEKWLAGRTADSPRLAMDSVPFDELADYAMNSSPWSEGLGFMGFGYLAEAQQRSEYRRICEIWAAESTRKWIKLKGDDPDRLAKLEARFRHFGVREKVRELVELDGSMGRAHLFLDIGDGPGQRDKPLVLTPETVPINGLKNLKVVEPYWVYPLNFNTTDPLADDFYSPSQWLVMGETVHASRLITVVGREVPDILKPVYMFGGLSLTQMVKSAVDNFVRNRKSIGDLLHAFSTMVLATNLGAMFTPEGASEMMRRISAFVYGRENGGLMLVDKESEELKNVSAQLAGTRDLLAQSMEMILIPAGIPMVVYAGTSPSGLNASSEGELQAWYAHVRGYNEKALGGPLETILRVLQLDMDGVIDESVSFEFVDGWQLDESALATVRKTNADTAAVYIQSGVISPENEMERLQAEEGGQYYGMKLEAPEEPSMDMGDDDPRGANDAESQHWITVHPDGEGSKGTPLLISANGTVEGGAGGRLDGRKLDNVKSMSNPRQRGNAPVDKHAESRNAGWQAAHHWLATSNPSHEDFKRTLQNATFLHQRNTSDLAEARESAKRDPEGFAESVATMESLHAQTAGQLARLQEHAAAIAATPPPAVKPTRGAGESLGDFAHRMSDHAMKEGTAAAHESAAQAHREAREEAVTKDDGPTARVHYEKGQEHELRADHATHGAGHAHDLADAAAAKASAAVEAAKKAKTSEAWKAAQSAHRAASTAYGLAKRAQEFGLGREGVKPGDLHGTMMAHHYDALNAAGEYQKALVREEKKKRTDRAKEAGAGRADVASRFANHSYADLQKHFSERWGLGIHEAREHVKAYKDFTKSGELARAYNNRHEDWPAWEAADAKNRELRAAANASLGTRVRNHTDVDLEGKSAAAKAQRAMLGHVEEALEHLEAQGFNVSSALRGANVKWAPASTGKNWGHAFQHRSDMGQARTGYFSISHTHSTPDKLQHYADVAQREADKGNGRFHSGSGSGPAHELRATIIHELTHALGMQDHIGSPSKLAKRLATAIPAGENRHQWISNNISRYGATNINETDAELAALVTSPHYQRGTLPKELEDHVDELFHHRGR